MMAADLFTTCTTLFQAGVVAVIALLGAQSLQARR
jgi:hypothetical protein